MASHASFSTLTSATVMASQTSQISLSSTMPNTSLHARMTIPTIGEVPSNDPVVYVSIVILISMIVLAVFLLVWTQRRSAREVWDSVQDTSKFRHLRNSSRFPIDSERPSWDASGEMEQGMVRISHRIPMADSECGSDTDSDDGELSEEEGDALAAVHAANCVRFSDPPMPPLRNLTRTPPATTALDGFEQVYDQFQASKMVDSLDGDLGVSSKQKQRASMSQQQLYELHLDGPSVS